MQKSRPHDEVRNGGGCVWKPTAAYLQPFQAAIQRLVELSGQFVARASADGRL